MTNKLNISGTIQDTRNLEKIKNKINELVDKIGMPAEKIKKDGTEGSSGDTRVSVNGDGTYNLEIRTEEGWKVPVFKGALITFDDKPKADLVVKKSIDEIETDDTNTGASKAKKTIFDEKADKFVLPRPDYESDWVDVTVNNSYTYTHNLGTKIFKLVQLIFKDDSDRIFYPGVGFHEDSSDDKGIYAWAQTDDIIQISTGRDTVFAYQNFPTIGDDFDVNDGYIKVMLWK